MTESQVANEWISQGEAKGKREAQRQNLLDLLEGRFPGVVPTEVVKLIQQQESLELLRDWFKAAVGVSTFEQFVTVSQVTRFREFRGDVSRDSAQPSR